MASILIALFKEQLENDSASIAQKYGLTKRGDLLSWWYFIRFVGLDDIEIGEIVCDGARDLGIDAIRIDEEKLVHFYQFKNPHSIQSGFATGDVDKCISGLALILSRNHTEIANPELRGHIDEIYQIIPSGYRLHLVTSGSSLDDEAITKLDNFVEALKAPEDFFCWSCEDIHFLQNQMYQKALPTVEEPIRFEIKDSPYAVRSANHDCWLFHVTGKALAELYQTYGEQLLQQNIRVSQGDRGTNAAIYKTCTGEDAGNFLHYNNGVTFLGDEAEWDHFTHSLTLKHGQLVNGGQTIRGLCRAHEEQNLRSDVLVTVRVVTSKGDESFANSVAVNLNNQNRVKASFLRSNSPQILQLNSTLATLGWYLERREKEVKNLSDLEQRTIESQIGRKLEGAVIPLQAGAQAYVAASLRQPELAKAHPKFIFLGKEDNGSFENIFSEQLRAEEFVLTYQLFLCVGNFIRQFASKKRRKDKLDDWRSEYATVVGSDIVEEFGDIVDQVVPQSAIFLTALAFEKWVRIQGHPLQELVEILETENLTFLQQLLSVILDYSVNYPNPGKSWPTLLKSQPFFDNVATYLKKLDTAESEADVSNRINALD